MPSTAMRRHTKPEMKKGGNSKRKRGQEEPQKGSRRKKSWYKRKNGRTRAKE